MKLAQTGNQTHDPSETTGALARREQNMKELLTKYRIQKKKKGGGGMLTMSCFSYRLLHTHGSRWPSKSQCLEAFLF